MSNLYYIKNIGSKHKKKTFAPLLDKKGNDIMTGYTITQKEHEILEDTMI